MSIEILGFAAGILTSISLLPQVTKAFKTHSTHDLSYQWMIINASGQMLWTLYGVAINSISLYFTSGLTLALVITLLIQKIKFDVNIKSKIGK